MELHTLRKTFKYKLMPTPEQVRALETVLLRCHMLYNVALEQRKTWWQRGQGIGASYYQQKAELPNLKDACPEYTEVHSQLLQDVLLRVERTYQAFFRRVKAGEQSGYPCFQGRGRYNSFIYPQYGNGAVLDGSILSLSQSVEDWPHPHPAAPSAVWHSQDRRDQPRSGWVVRLHLVCGGATSAVATDRQ